MEIWLRTGLEITAAFGKPVEYNLDELKQHDPTYIVNDFREVIRNVS
jgi:hypothetical protein